MQALAVGLSKSRKIHQRGRTSRKSHAPLPTRLLSLRVVQFEIAAQIRRCTPAKAKYCTETDSKQVVQTKDEKPFEKRVKSPRHRWTARVRGPPKGFNRPQASHCWRCLPTWDCGGLPLIVGPRTHALSAVKRLAARRGGLLLLWSNVADGGTSSISFYGDWS